MIASFQVNLADLAACSYSTPHVPRQLVNLHKQLLVQVPAIQCKLQRVRSLCTLITLSCDNKRCGGQSVNMS